MRTTILCLLLSAVAISADLQSELDDIVSHLPMEQLVQVSQKYVATYPKMRASLQYAQTLDYEEIAKDLMKVKQVDDVLQYLNRHGIDAEHLMLHMIRMAKEFHRRSLEPQSADQIKSGLPVITGNLMADYLAVMSSSDIATVFEEKLHTSPDFANFIAAIRDPEFKTLYYRATHSSDRTMEMADSKVPQARGFFSKVWKKVKDIGFGVGVTIPLGK